METPPAMRVQLVFNSFFKLWYFKLLLNSKKLKINRKTRSLCGECTEAELELAVHAYKASVKRDEG
jgi:hypothetical protein